MKNMKTYFYEFETGAKTPVKFFVFSDLHITGISKKREGGEVECDAIELAGFNIPGHYIKNVKFKNIKIDSDKPRKHSLSLQCCEGVSFENIYVK